METRARNSFAIIALMSFALLAVTCGTPPAAPTTTAPVPPTATFTSVLLTSTPVSVSKTLATTLSLSAPSGSQQVTGTLKDQAGVPIAGATIEFAVTALDGAGLFAQYTLTGTVPAGATQADVGLRVNTECGCAGTSEFFLYDARYVQGSETANRVPNSSFAQGLNGWGFWGTGTTRLEPSDQGQGQMLHVTVTPSQTAAINSTRFPASAGATYTLTFSARVGSGSAGSGYFDIVFLDSSKEETRKQIPLKTAVVTIGSTTTDKEGAFRFTLSHMASGKFLLEARYPGGMQYLPEIASATVLGPTPIPPTPVPSDLVWFAPNMGSRDYAELFKKPAQWSRARSRINVVKFYTQNVLEYPCPICGDDTLKTFVEAQAFQKLKEWGIAISVEVGVVKEYGCTGEEEFRGAKTAIQNIQANGGVIAFLDMDEPFIGGQQVINGKTCGHTMEKSATVTSQFIQQVKAAYPNIIVGDTEPYPYFSVPELERWIVAVKDRGATPAFFHLDVDIERVRVERSNVSADLQRLSQFFRQRGIPFGVIFTSNWHAAYSDRAYFDSTMEWVRTVNAAIGRPQHVIFNSWQGAPADREHQGVHEVPINLPENDSAIYSHTRLLNEGLAVFGR